MKKTMLKSLSKEEAKGEEYIKWRINEDWKIILGASNT